MIGLVVDTNVLVSAGIKLTGNEAAILDLVAVRAVELWVSQPILAEYEEVLWRPRLRLDPIRVQWTIDFIRHESHIVVPARRLVACSHDPDNRFLECAEAASADFLVTGNKRHFPSHWKSIRVVNAREFLNTLRPE
jgi:putative PIN family toxin of toxin-antitoxin system